MLHAERLTCIVDDRPLFAALTLSLAAGELLQVAGDNGAGKTSLLRILCGLAGYEDLPLSQLSAGQQRRVALTRLWLTDAPLWILDEPFTALDATAMETLTRRLEQHARQGGCAILTTHQPLRPLGCPLRTLRLGGDAGGGQ